MNITAPASAALLAVARGFAPATFARADAPAVLHVGDNQPAPRDIAYPGTLEIHVDATDIGVDSPMYGMGTHFRSRAGSLRPDGNPDFARHSGERRNPF